MMVIDKAVAIVFDGLWRTIEFWLCTRLHESMKLSNGGYVHFWRGPGIAFWGFPDERAEQEFMERWR